jgi:hypothetical protein
MVCPGLAPLITFWMLSPGRTSQLAPKGKPHPLKRKPNQAKTARVPRTLKTLLDISQPPLPIRTFLLKETS